MADEVETTIDYTELGMKRGIKPPLIRIPEAAVIASLRRSLPMLDISEKHLELINNAIALCQKQEDEHITTLQQVSESMGVSVSTARNHAKYLHQSGVFKQRYCTTDPKNKRRGLLYEFCVPDLSIKLEDVQVRVEESRPLTHMNVEDVELISQADLADMAFCDLVTTVLFGALRFNQKGNQTKIESHVVWGAERVKVETRSGKGERIALLKDLKYYIAAITVLETIIRERICNGEEITETFNIPMNSILTVLKLPKTGGNKTQALRAIRRLSGTSFHMHQLPKWFLLKYGMSENSVLHLNILTLRLEGESKEVPGSLVLQMQFPPETIAQIRRRFDGEAEAFHELTKIQPFVLSITNNLVFAFNLWSSAYFSETGMAVMDWLELKDRTAPQFTLHAFKKAFSDILKKHAVPATTISGYTEDGKGIEIPDESYEPIYKNGIALRETASILGVKVVLDEQEFVLMPEIKQDSLLVQNLVSPYLSNQLKK
ncbi:TPA: hypothetical protein ACGSTL_001158 [Vibrio parahaemolyticus]|uniref:hypothetical protein n=1 Tax=Vibrio campbellii TaxID=680 RepID=UPI001F07C196|nr:hypothetical protein [Vibrio campbellii]UMM06581.1 hypothetical protein MKR81_26910 [Vibrio campbellii]